LRHQQDDCGEELWRTVMIGRVAAPRGGAPAWYRAAPVTRRAAGKCSSARERREFGDLSVGGAKLKVQGE
jgi:hypothetical protein